MYRSGTRSSGTFQKKLSKVFTSKVNKKVRIVPEALPNGGQTNHYYWKIYSGNKCVGRMHKWNDKYSIHIGSGFSENQYCQYDISSHDLAVKIIKKKLN